jgi:hypothetical protein
MTGRRPHRPWAAARHYRFIRRHHVQTGEFTDDETGDVLPARSDASWISVACPSAFETGPLRGKDP